MSALINTPKYKDLIYDIGMHKGEDTEFYLRKGFRVIAFEADPDLVSFSKIRLKNFIDQGRLTIIEGAIVAVDAKDMTQKQTRFYKNDSNSLWGTTCGSWAERNIRLGASSRTISVDKINFEVVLQNYGVPHYMKIDIEGSDMICLNVLKKFRERPNYLSIESDKISFAKIKYEIHVLLDLGYDSFQAIEQSAIPLSQSPPYPPREGEYIAQRFEPVSSGLFGSELSDRWKSKDEILRQYRIIRLGYYLLGDDGIIKRLEFRGNRSLRILTRNFWAIFTKVAIPGWYDTHARHFSVDASISRS